MVPSSNDYATGSAGPVRSRRSAPLGIKIYCVLAGLVGLYTLFLSLRIMGAGGPFFALGFLFFLLTIGFLAVLYGLWTLKPWAWTWGMILFAVNLFFNLLQLDLIGLLINLVLIAYLASKQDLYRS